MRSARIRSLWISTNPSAAYPLPILLSRAPLLLLHRTPQLLLRSTFNITAGPFQSELSLFYLLFSIITRSPMSNIVWGSTIFASCILLYFSLDFSIRSPAFLIHLSCRSCHKFTKGTYLQHKVILVTQSMKIVEKSFSFLTIPMTIYIDRVLLTSAESKHFLLIYQLVTHYLLMWVHRNAKMNNFQEYFDMIWYDSYAACYPDRQQKCAFFW